MFWYAMLHCTHNYKQLFIIRVNIYVHKIRIRVAGAWWSLEGAQCRQLVINCDQSLPNCCGSLWARLGIIQWARIGVWGALERRMNTGGNDNMGQRLRELGLVGSRASVYWCKLVFQMWKVMDVYCRAWMVSQREFHQNTEHCGAP